MFPQYVPYLTFGFISLSILSMLFENSGLIDRLEMKVVIFKPQTQYTVKTGHSNLKHDFFPNKYCFHLLTNILY